MKSFLLLLFFLLTASASAAEPFELKDGDRVVFVGSTLIEREQRYGYWESALTRRWPDRNITFRNLGWSGDTVWGDARASFDSRAEGFKRLKESVLAFKPTVIFIGYGTNESFEGEAGLPAFKKGLETLLDVLAPAKARIVLLSPLKQADLGPPMPKPTEQNKKLELYTNEIQKTAKQRRAKFINLFESREKGPLWAPWTDNGIHLSEKGYFLLASLINENLGGADEDWVVDVDIMSKKVEARQGTKIDRVEVDPKRIRFEAIDDRLFALGEAKTLQFASVGVGPYSLYIDGKRIDVGGGRGGEPVLKFAGGPDFDQSEKLRQAIIAKNRLFFYRWRPANETYLFGFRKNEQGRNAAEMPMFDPLIAKMEAEIAKLRVPVKHTYELKKVEAKP